MVTPPSTKMKGLPPQVITSGEKYVGAAVLARTSCHSGKFRLFAGCFSSLYFANGLFEIGHGESVVALRITRSSSDLMPGEPSVVSSPNTAFNCSASGELLNFDWNSDVRLEKRPVLSNIRAPFFT